MAFLGILSFGGIFAGVNPSHTTYELVHAFQTAEIKALVVEAELLPNALESAAQAGIPERTYSSSTTTHPSLNPGMTAKSGARGWAARNDGAGSKAGDTSWDVARATG